MTFDVKGKVALVTGGASGIGLCFADEILKNGGKGVVLSDIDEVTGQNSATELGKKYGSNRVTFVKTDVTNRENFENAFRETLSHFNHIDILVNGAGIMNETDEGWENMVSININGVIHGIHLAMEKYLKDHKQGPEAVVLNVASIAGLASMPVCPLYGATKAAIVYVTRALGSPVHFEATKVRLIAICPGITRTPIFGKVQLHPRAGDVMAVLMRSTYQGPEFVAEQAVKVLEKAENGSVWVIDKNSTAYQFTQFLEVDTK